MTLRRIATLLTACALLPIAARGASVSAKMNVSVQVIARAIARVDARPGTIVVTKEDVKRGYVDAAEPMVVNVRTNSRGGCILHVMNNSSAFTAVELMTGTLSLRVASESFISRAYVVGGESLVMTVRLRLAPDMREGEYAFPVDVSAEPIG